MFNYFFDSSYAGLIFKETILILILIFFVINLIPLTFYFFFYVFFLGFQQIAKIRVFFKSFTTNT